MTDAELLADTNRLLAELLKTNRKRSEVDEARLAETMERTAKMQDTFKKMTRERLQRLGIAEPESPSDDTESPFLLAERLRRESEEKWAAKQKEQEDFRNALLAELGVQSDLLRNIAEKLGC